jgi:hypothetical protein
VGIAPDYEVLAVTTAEASGSEEASDIQLETAQRLLEEELTGRI